MWHRNESDWRCRRDAEAGPRRTSKFMRLLCGAVVVGTLPWAAGCSPELLVGGAIVGSVLYAHANKDKLPTKREPVLHESRTYYPSPGVGGRVYMADNPPTQRTEGPSRSQALTTSPIVEGARAYWELRWDDAAKILGRVIDEGVCTEPELGQAHLLLGAMAYQQGDAEMARKHFIQAHRQDPQLELSPRLFPPQVIDFYQNARGP